MVANQVSIMKFILLLILIQFTSAQKLVRLSSSIERASLLELRSSLGLRTTDWPIKTDPCLTWIGVQCGTNNGRVIGINVSGLRRTRIGRLNPLFSVDSLSNFTHLTSFNASGFLLPGSIPHLFGQNLQSLQVLDLRSCSVTDPIPFSIGNLSNLNSLYLSGNGITGIIPETLGQLSKLSILDLSQNLLTGSIPSSFASLTNITRLDLSSNFLSGPIPPTLGGLKKLVFLDLSNNSLSASIPGELGDLSGLVNLDLSTNSLSGSLPLELKGMRTLKRMGLGHNNLDGSLPVSLWSMPELVFLDVSYNNFTGVLPLISWSSSNADQRVFNLSNNQFYGNLSSGIGAFSFIDLSVNYFQGKVDDNNNVKSFYLASNCLQNVLNQRSMEECSLFYVDKGLVLEKFGQPNASQPPKRALGRRSKKKLIFILVGVLGGLCFLVLLVLLLVVCSRKRETSANDERRASTSLAVGETPGPPVVSKDFSHVGELFTYEQLLRATGDFSDSNLIKHGHSGDLFRGVLEGGTLVVVKRVEVHSVKKETYLGELELFSKISHTRLVPFLGHCLVHENEKLLVYKYMPNGDLSTSLYRKSRDEDENLHTLDWITRLKIAIGAAEGLSYLHHECSPPLVHRDVQASSILLDDKFEVRLGSLSEICSQEGDTQQGVITRLLRLPQNSEQGSSSVPSSETCAYDVYCFGKVLLELVTGRLGISSSNDETVDEWLEITLQCISLYEKELITKIVDSTLIIDDDLLEEVWAMAIVAKSCLHPKPSKRPLMRYVLKALENPLKVVREENSGSDRLKGSWNASVFGSWRHSSTEITIAPTVNTKEEVSSFKQSGAISSQGSRQSGAGELLSSNKKKLSGDIFPEPSHLPDY